MDLFVLIYGSSVLACYVFKTLHIILIHRLTLALAGTATSPSHEQSPTVCSVAIVEIFIVTSIRA